VGAPPRPLAARAVLVAPGTGQRVWAAVGRLAALAAAAVAARRPALAVAPLAAVAAARRVALAAAPAAALVAGHCVVVAVRRVVLAAALVTGPSVVAAARRVALAAARRAELAAARREAGMRQGAEQARARDGPSEHRDGPTPVMISDGAARPLPRDRTAPADQPDLERARVRSEPNRGDARTVLRRMGDRGGAASTAPRLKQNGAS
jgi:hypothetical protein